LGWLFSRISGSACYSFESVPAVTTKPRCSILGQRNHRCCSSRLLSGCGSTRESLSMPAPSPPAPEMGLATLFSVLCREECGHQPDRQKCRTAQYLVHVRCGCAAVQEKSPRRNADHRYRESEISEHAQRCNFRNSLALTA